MRRILCVAALLLWAWPAHAAEEAKPARLTPKEVAEGWILLFDGETLFGWNAVNDAKWNITGGMLAPQAESKGALVTTTEWADFDLNLEYQVKKGSDAKLMVGCNDKGHNSGVQDVYMMDQKMGGWTELTVKVRGSKILGWDLSSGGLGKPGISMKVGEAPDQPKRGHLAFVGNGVVLRNIKLKPTNTQPLFNGKDLTGWKEYPNQKSKFTVTKEGWLNVKDGKGDLQTEDQWADFVLQLECISNGDGLNSGIFFRCIPGEYQNGYEAQIHNKFDAEAKKEYEIEEYDPKTNELKAKKKVKYQAADYGTGAIYRRIPARMQMSKDKEWFTMTVVAHGRHLAVWVNGVQVTDWTDNRPTNKNPRNGCRLEKGPISLQGHDPTTDLSFRNFRLAELPRAEGKK